MTYTCTLELKNNKCQYLLENKGCKGNTPCCFCRKGQVDPIAIEKSTYERKERWYEKYYSRANHPK